MLRHERCGGELRKYGKKPGRYRCVVCKTILKLGYAGPSGGYIRVALGRLHRTKAR